MKPIFFAFSIVSLSSTTSARKSPIPSALRACSRISFTVWYTVHSLRLAISTILLAMSSSAASIFLLVDMTLSSPHQRASDPINYLFSPH